MLRNSHNKDNIKKKRWLRSWKIQYFVSYFDQWSEQTKCIAYNIVCLFNIQYLLRFMQFALCLFTCLSVFSSLVLSKAYWFLASVLWKDFWCTSLVKVVVSGMDIVIQLWFWEWRYYGGFTSTMSKFKHEWLNLNTQLPKGGFYGTPP